MKKKLRDLTKDEKAILRNLDTNYKYIARDKSGILYVYEGKPRKNITYWTSRIGYSDIFLFKNSFKFIKWEDDEPYLIEELLKDEY